LPQLSPKADHCDGLLACRKLFEIPNGSDYLDFTPAGQERRTGKRAQITTVLSFLQTIN
jgi:hypothetical protein